MTRGSLSSLSKSCRSYWLGYAVVLVWARNHEVLNPAGSLLVKLCCWVGVSQKSQKAQILQRPYWLGSAVELVWAGNHKIFISAWSYFELIYHWLLVYCTLSWSEFQKYLEWLYFLGSPPRNIQVVLSWFWVVCVCCIDPLDRADIYIPDPYSVQAFQRVST